MRFLTKQLISHVLGHRGIVGFVNGVLRNIQRKGVRQPTQLQPINKRLSIQYSLPQWLIDEFINLHGKKKQKNSLNLSVNDQN